MGSMSARRITRLVGVAVTGWAGLTGAIGIPSVAAQPCPAVDVVFARGTDEPPGPGGLGRNFLDALRPKLGGRSVNEYSVNYPATRDWHPSISAGAADAAAHAKQIAVACPDTRIVLAGFSQGAAVIDVITGVPVRDVAPAPLPPDVADQVAAVAVFGNPSLRYGAGAITEASPQFGARAIDLCLPRDPVCTRDGSGDMAVHNQYPQAGMVDRAATFIASRV